MCRPEPCGGGGPDGRSAVSARHSPGSGRTENRLNDPKTLAHARGSDPSRDRQGASSFKSPALVEPHDYRTVDDKVPRAEPRAAGPGQQSIARKRQNLDLI